MTSSGAPEPVLGWRLWRLRGGRLASWAIDNSWMPGENVAECLAPASHRCPVSPGVSCRCGIWALWSLRDCLTRARREEEHDLAVLGLIGAWGTVALHGGEGFRTQRAGILCLLVDGHRELAEDASPRWPRLHRLACAVGLPHTRAPLIAGLGQAHRRDLLEPVADAYGVPLVSLEVGLGSGLLREFGLASERLAEAGELLARRPSRDAVA